VRRRLRLPRRRNTAEGRERRVGVEIELIGLELNDIAELVASRLNLSITMDGRYRRLLGGDPAGDWAVELDFDFLQRLGQQERGTDDLLDELRDSAEDLLKTLAELVVPKELVSPPLPMHRLGEIETLIELLRAAGARGTSDSVGYAFGMQFNPEVPGESARDITPYLRAFLCLYPWLYLRAKVDLTRRITSYIDPFPLDYVRKVVAPAYAPALDTLIDDYLEWNPTRNRALDFLPLFLHLDEERVRNVTDDPLIKPRPALHYRLPNCDIHHPDWGFYLAWNEWLEVEELAARPRRLAKCCEAYSKFLANPLQRWMGDWAKEVERQWLRR